MFAEPRIVDQVVYIAGDTISYRQLADAVDELLDLNVRRTEWSVPDLKRELAEDPGNSIKKYRAVFAEGKGVAWDKSQTFNVQRSIAACGLEEWMRNNLLPSEGVALEDASHPE